MEFLKHKAGLIVLILSLIVIASVVWYLMFDMGGGGGYEGGTLVEGMNDLEMWKTALARVCRNGWAAL